MQWTEKYRPQCLNDIVGQFQTIKAIRKMLNNGGPVNMLFYGPPGTGKTALAEVIAKQVLGASLSLNFRKINASNERSLEHMRDSVLQTMRFMPLDPTKPRIILLDEADGIHKNAQRAFREPLEQNSRTIFLMTANYYDMFIEALTSRLMVFEMGPLTEDDIEIRLKQIVDSEKKRLPKKLYVTIAKEANGDIRRAINELQKAVALH